MIIYTISLAAHLVIIIIQKVSPKGLNNIKTIKNLGNIIFGKILGEYSKSTVRLQPYRKFKIYIGIHKEKDIRKIIFLETNFFLIC